METIDFSSGQFVIGQDEFTYQEVVDDFENAEFIGILTYNISPNGNSKLLQALKNACANGARATVITNIPKRFQRYYGDKPAQDAKRNIIAYINQLNPEEYSGMLAPYFHLENHAKIIMTDNVLYWGSSNYSDESSSNLECGTISRDADLIKFVQQTVFPQIAKEAVPYYSPRTTEAFVSLQNAAAFCDAVYQQVHDLAFCPWADYDTGFKEVWVYQPEYAGDAAKAFLKFSEGIQEYEEALDVIREITEDHIFADDPSDELMELISIYDSYQDAYFTMTKEIENLSEEVEQIAHYNVEDETFLKLDQDYGMEAYEENLDEFMEKAMDDAQDEYSDLANEAETSITDILEQIKQMGEYFTELAERLRRILSTRSRIDNTGV